MSMITLNSAVTSAFDKEIASSGLVMEFRSYQAVNQSILTHSADLAFHVSKSNITDVFFAMEHEWTAIANDATLNLAWYRGVRADDINSDLNGNVANRVVSDATVVGRQRFKPVSFFHGPNT